MHNETEQAMAWSQIFSEETMKQSIPVITSWQLNERMYVHYFSLDIVDIIFTLILHSVLCKLLCCSVFRYGELQGLNKQETADRFGKEKVHEWRRSYDIPPPNGESLEMCAKRAVAYFKEHVRIHFHLLKF